MSSYSALPFILPITTWINKFKVNSSPSPSTAHHMAWEKKVLTFNFHPSTFISIHEYANPTVPVAITMQAPTGRCQHCQGRKKPTPFRLLGHWVCVWERQTDAPVYLWPIWLLSQSTENQTSPIASSVHTHTHLCPLSYTHQWDTRALKDLWTK